MTCWLTDLQIVDLTDWVIDWLTGWLADWQTDLLTDWSPDWLTGWQTGWLADSLIDWLKNCVSAWLTEKKENFMSYSWDNALPLKTYSRLFNQRLAV